MRIYRDIATLAGAQVVCFLLLSHLEPAFFCSISTKQLFTSRF